MTAEEVIRLGLSVGASMAIRGGQWHEIEDTKQDAALGAYQAWLARPDSTRAYLAGAARHFVYQTRNRAEYRGSRKDGRFWILTETQDPWARTDAALDVGRLAEGLSPKRLAALKHETRTEGYVMTMAEQRARLRAIEEMRCRALVKT